MYPTSSDRSDPIVITGEETPEILDIANRIAEKYLEAFPNCQRVRIYTKEHLSQEDPYNRMVEMPDIIEFTFWYHTTHEMKLYVDTLLSTDLLVDVNMDEIMALLIKDSNRQLKGLRLYERKTDS